MSHLLDVNFLVACGWRAHQHYAAARAWLDRQHQFATCPITQLGFLRVSIGPGHRASFEDAMIAFEAITKRKGAIFIPNDLPAGKITPVASHADITDAYLVALSKAHNLKLATLDDALCAKPWATSIAENPLNVR